MVVPLVVPSVRTGSPVVTALAEVELVPFWYVLDRAQPLRRLDRGLQVVDGQVEMHLLGNGGAGPGRRSMGRDPLRRQPGRIRAHHVRIGGDALTGATQQGAVEVGQLDWIGYKIVFVGGS
jgi:hypothetical protein